MIWRKIGRRKLTAEETAANAAKRAERDRLSLHCQCCDRKIMANTGKIAHHGYLRPSIGWQTGSCMGARHLPFEADREQLGVMIEALKRQLKGRKAHRAKVFAEELPVELWFTDYQAPKVNGKFASVKIEFTRANFSAMMEQHTKLVNSRRWQMTSFDEIKKRDLAIQDNNNKSLSEFIANRQSRFDGWKKTHAWNGEIWKKVKS